MRPLKILKTTFYIYICIYFRSGIYIYIYAEVLKEGLADTDQFGRSCLQE